MSGSILEGDSGGVSGDVAGAMLSAAPKEQTVATALLTPTEDRLMRTAFGRQGGGEAGRRPIGFRIRARTARSVLRPAAARHGEWVPLKGPLLVLGRIAVPGEEPSADLAKGAPTRAVSGDLPAGAACGA